MDLGNRCVPFEFKLNAAPEQSQLKGLRNCMADLGIRKGYVVYPGKEDYSLGQGVEALAAGMLLRNPKKIEAL